MQPEDKPRSSQGEVGLRPSKYTAMETMPLRSSLNKPRLTLPEGEKTSSSKHFYLRKSKNEVGLSYNSSQFTSYLSAQKENIDDNLSSTLRNYLNLKKDKLVFNSKKCNGILDPKKSNSSSTAAQLLTHGKENNENLLREKLNFMRSSQEAFQSPALKLASQRTHTAPSETATLRPVLQEISSNRQPQEKPNLAIEHPEKSGDTPKKVVNRKTKVEVRDSYEKDISVVKNSIQLDPTRRSTQESGIIKSYAVNTNEGLVRNYNEDRVSIILNIMQSGKMADSKWPKCAFFGVYDGHCGSACAEFLRDNLHKFILRDKNFPSNPKEALREGIRRAESEFYKRSIDSKGELVDKSGSCALILLVVNETCFIANVGDSRAVLSKDGGRQCSALTQDHKPCSPSEKERIMKAGGKIYRTQIQTISLESDRGEEVEKEEIVNGPFRVFPGRLSVSRTFGDFEAKLQKYGGNPNVVIVEPEIFEVPVDSSSDFILLGCDGLFDRFTTEDLVSRIWETSATKAWKGNYHEVAAEMVEGIFADTFQRKAWDNITVILICFKNMFDSLLRMKTRLHRSEKEPRQTLL
jgi:protein phosphatase 2C family protein 2/3